MHKTLLSVGLAALSLATSPTTNAAGTRGAGIETSYTIGDRNYTTYVPPGIDASKPAPAILLLHPFGIAGDKFTRYTNIEPYADQQGFVVIAPDGKGLIGNFSPAWNSGTVKGYSADDVSFIRATLDQVQATGILNPDRLYIAGMSSGGAMVYRTVCEIPGRFAAMAVIAAGETRDASNPAAAPATNPVYACPTTRPLPLLTMNGTGDGCFPYAGGTTAAIGGKGTPVPPVIEDLAEWAGNNDCPATSLPNAATVYTSGDVTCRAITSCASQSQVQSCVMNGVGHVWPGAGNDPTTRLLCGKGPQTQDIDATKYIWAFFRNYTLQGLAPY